MKLSKSEQNVYSKIKQGFIRLFRKMKPQCPCPGCTLDLAKHGTFVDEDDFVYYTCRNCGTSSIWDFEPQYPLLIHDYVKGGEGA